MAFNNEIMVASGGDEQHPGEPTIENIPSSGGNLDNYADSTTAIVDADKIVTREDANGTWYKKTFGKVWDYLKEKLGIADSGNTFLKKDGTWATPDVVRQSPASEDNVDYRVLFSNTSNDDDETDITRKDADFLYNPSTNNLVVRKVNGNDVSKEGLLSLLHPVGTIIESTTCNTMAKVVAAYGGTTWKQHTGYVLRGASSGVTANQNTNDGGADSVTVSSVANHGHTVDAVSIPSSGSHIHNYAYGTYTAGYEAISLTPRLSTTEGATLSSTGSNHTHSVPAHNANSNGSNYTINTLPKYKKVYIWERTA